MTDQSRDVFICAHRDNLACLDTLIRTLEEARDMLAREPDGWDGYAGAGLYADVFTSARGTELRLLPRPEGE